MPTEISHGQVQDALALEGLLCAGQLPIKLVLEVSNPAKWIKKHKTVPNVSAKNQQPASGVLAFLRTGLGLPVPSDPPARQQTGRFIRP
jgi:hypothetical protein